MNLYVGLAVATVAGIASHLGYFKHGEHHMYGTKYIQGFLVVFATYITYGVIYCQEESSLVVSRFLSFSACYFGGLYASLLWYRIYFSPLQHFPGPFAAKISRLWFSAKIRKLDAFRKVHELHEKYGDFVRIGPTDLSTIHPKAVQAIYAFGAPCRKGAWYDLLLPHMSLQLFRDRASHDASRRIWAPAFKENALRGYKERLESHQERLIDYISFRAGTNVNISKLFMLYSFDVMGDLGYGKSFGMLDSSEYHWSIQLLKKGVRPPGLMLPEWLWRVMIAIPKLSDDWWNFLDYSKATLHERMRAEKAAPDIVSFLLEPIKDRKPSPQEMLLLEGDSQLIIIAGSDTTAATLIHVIYELIRNPKYVEVLRSELAPYLATSQSLSYEDLLRLERLDSVIYEVLRLHPVVPTNLQRMTPPEGLKIGDTFIPGNTNIFCPQYAMGRNENVYPQASSFIPERWTSRPELVKERSAFAPFSTGPSSCAGRPLALLNLRTTLIRILQRFDFEFAPGESGHRVEEDGVDHFTFEPGACEVVFRERS